MRINRIYNGLRWSACAAGMLAALGTGCQSEESREVLPTEGIVFNAMVNEGSPVPTRALVLNDITSDPYNIDFFVQLDYAANRNTTNQPSSEIARYTVASNYRGRLSVKGETTPLNWKDLRSDHTFYGWTLPWLEESPEQYATYDDISNYYSDPEQTKPVTEIIFHDSGDGDDYKKYHNNKILEKFIGAQSGPYNYKTQGADVPFVFYHLVSKIHLGRLRLYEPDESYHDDLKANLTFIGMPNVAVFDPHPKTPINKPHPAEWITYPGQAWDEHPHHPVVIGPEEGFDSNSSVVFHIPESGTDGRQDDTFYICPEVDFSQIRFKVKITDERYSEYGDHGEFYGDFSAVKFVRQRGNDYDDESDDTVLHAGEMMTLNITLRAGSGAGAALVIKNWNDEQPKNSQHHAHPGIYSNGEAQRLADAFKKSDLSEEELNNLFEMYGDDGTEEEKKVFKLYENVAIVGSSFPVAEGCIIDGMGHEITLKPSPVTIGPMRDVYLTDGTNTLWIDSEGQIWTYNAKTRKFDQKKGPLQAGKSSYTIDLKTGAVS